MKKFTTMLLITLLTGTANAQEGYAAVDVGAKSIQLSVGVLSYEGLVLEGKRTITPGSNILADINQIAAGYEFIKGQFNLTPTIGYGWFKKENPKKYELNNFIVPDIRNERVVYSVEVGWTREVARVYISASYTDHLFLNVGLKAFPWR